MVPVAHRQLVVFAAFAVLSWALVAGAPVLAAAPANQAGPQLPPAEYKPLPKGTLVTYDTWGYTVTKTEGFDITFKTTAGNWKHYYAVFGKHGEEVYGTQNARGDSWETTLDDESRSALESLWPLKVGKKIVLDLKEEWSPEDDGSTGGFGYEIQMWTVSVLAFAVAG